jgi:arginine N-succinyltransferase
MYYEGYVDIFDAGPVLQGRVSELRAVRDSVLAVAAEGLPVEDHDAAPDTEHMLVSNTRLGDFRMILTRAVPGATSVVLKPEELAQLGCRAGDHVRTLTLNTRKTSHG